MNRKKNWQKLQSLALRREKSNLFVHGTTKAFLQSRFGARVYKIPLHAGLTCPNRDGTKGWGGCTYCNNESFSPNARGTPKSLREQLREGIAFYQKRGGQKFLGYFQSYTNTYAPAAYLQALWEAALSFPEVVGLAIGTRPDCLEEDALDLLEAYSQAGYFVAVELGCESSHDETLKRLHREHTFADFVRGVEQVRAHGLFLTAHVILGLPGETKEAVLQTARRLARLPIQAVKLHHFYIARGTPLARQHTAAPLPTLSLEAYREWLRAFLAELPESILVERILGETNPEFVVAPHWNLPKPQLIAYLQQ